MVKNSNFGEIKLIIREIIFIEPSTCLTRVIYLYIYKDYTIWHRYKIKTPCLY